MSAVSCAVSWGGCSFRADQVKLKELEVELVMGPVAMGVHPSFPIEIMDFILGNNLAGGKILVKPVVPVVAESPDKLTQEYPEVFSACAVTRAMSKRGVVNKDVIDLSDSFMVNDELSLPDALYPYSFPVEDGDVGALNLGGTSMAREQLVSEKKGVAELSPLFDSAVGAEERVPLSQGILVQDGVLIRKWTQLYTSQDDDWSVIRQVVVPSKYHRDILSLAHDHLLAGHLGINKTYDRAVCHFFWPGLKRDVV